MKPATHTKGHFSSGQRQTTASTPVSRQGHSVPNIKGMEQGAGLTSEETLIARMKEAQQNLSAERAKSVELREQIEAKKRRIAEMENLHVGNQKLIEKYEREITSQKPDRKPSDLQARIAALEASSTAACTQLDAALKNHFEMIAQLEVDDLPEKHGNKVVELSLSQLRLYLGQIHQKYDSFRMKLDGMQRRRRAIFEESELFRGDVRDSRAARLEDMKKLQKLTRLEMHSMEVIRSNHVKPVDEIATEATREVFVKLQAKMPKEEDDCNFLRNLGEKLRSRGVHVDF